MTVTRHPDTPADTLPYELLNPGGLGPVLLVCEHASNEVPSRYGDLGLSEAQRQSHSAWDPGALALAKLLSECLDARLVAATVSRLLFDVNRAPEATDAIVEQADGERIPGNGQLSEDERQYRQRAYYQPFHDAIAEQLTPGAGALGSANQMAAVISIHSFTPVFRGHTRTVELGVVHDEDSRLADQILNFATAQGQLRVARNDPYGPEDGVTHTLRRHGLARGLFNVMLEVRNDLLASATAQRRMADLLSPVLAASLAALGVKTVCALMPSTDEVPI